jgi:hypothetical protein
MSSPNGLLAWIKQIDTDCCVAAYVGEGAGPDPHRGYPGRAPATQVCRSPDAARAWITQEAVTLRLPVKWMDDAPWRGPDRLEINEATSSRREGWFGD